MRSSHGSLVPTECPPGRYGKKCALSCSCANGSSCHHATGACLCAAGWSGPHCSQRGYGDTGMRMRAGARGADHILNPPPACTPGSWGDACSQRCQCHNRGTCDPVEGTCHCPAGWTGTSCEEGRGPPPPAEALCTPRLHPGGAGGVIWGCCLSSMELYGATHPLYPCRVPPWDLRITV